MYKPISEYIIVSVSVAPVHIKPKFSLEIVTQALFWEKLIIITKKNNWIQIKQKDGYIGWIHSFYTKNSKIYEEIDFLRNYENWYLVKNKLCEIKLDKNLNFYLSFGSVIPCRNINNTFKTMFPNGKEYCIKKSALSTITKKNTIKTVLNLSEKLLGVPYLWGGKSSFGFDCSGFIQSVLNIMNINFPRDTNEQIKYKKLFQIKSNNIKPGNLIYFFDNNISTHVGIFIDSSIFIHSSGYVRKSSILKNNTYFDKKLSNMEYKIFKLVL